MSVTVEIDEKLAEKIDIVTKVLQVKREDFVEDALRRALEKAEITEKERQHREGYEKFPVQPDEFEIEDEQMEEFWKQV